MQIIPLQDILTEEMNRLSGPLDVLETGCVRETRPEWEHNDGWSTVALAAYVRKNGGSATSIDLDTRAADCLLTEKGLREHVHLITGYSVNELAIELADKGEPSYDLMLLDSADDPTLILCEYFLAKQLIRPGGTILVDDASLDITSPAVKARALRPWLDKEGTPYRILNRAGSNYSTEVIAVDF